MHPGEGKGTHCPMASFAELNRRSNFLLRRQPFFRHHVPIEMRDNHDNVIKEYRIGRLVNVIDNYKNVFIMVSAFSEEDFALLDSGRFEKVMKSIEEVKMTWGNVDHLLNDPGDSSSSVFTSRVYLFTGKLSAPRDLVRSAFKKHGLDVAIIDDDRWSAEWEAAVPDAFICHDSRDKKEYADPIL
jgi:hypothetical protein